MNGLLLSGIVVLALILLALLGFGFINIRTGLKALPRAEELGQEAVWHKQPNILLGINNFIFALLIGTGVLLSQLPDQRFLLLVLLGILLLLSVFLVIRTMQTASAAANRLRQRLSKK